MHLDSQRLAFILVWLTALLQLVTCLQDVDIESRFRVEKGEKGQKDYYGGTCKDVDLDLNAMYKETIDMAQVAKDAMDNYSQDEKARKMLKNYFGIIEDGDHHIKNGQDRFDFVKKIFETILSDAKQKHDDKTPSLFCDSDWRFATTWLYDEKTGEKTDKTLEETGKPESTMFWAPFFKAYTGTKEGCKDQKLAFAFQGDASSITICPYSRNMPKKKESLSAWHSGDVKVKDNAPLVAALSIPGTFLHELTHLLTHGDDHIVDEKVTWWEDYDWDEAPIDETSDDDMSDSDNDNDKDDNKDCGKSQYVAYTPRLCGLLARKYPYMAIKNADSYRWFATAMYIRQCDWSTMRCKQTS
ncbi:hypothetical protein NUU61_002937 [Penicillium alfredii]|uniref:Lysine-specific metallo-endopeptidase domain-containing protein n=1 Tax=Penicillium alfredii TaxID=1506179 RepID=A0A9W9FT67_9EURO|nr:uncharacterized protein NUU61_002937 [Penicillium alfredii]KAJ5105590.1 hypothetical protein NUU61_002937 [Penicillium alfredii]